MSLYRILKEEINQPPFENPHPKSDVKDFLRKELYKYLKNILSYPNLHHTLDYEQMIAIKPVFNLRVQKLIESINYSLDSYYQGDFIEAYNIFSDGLSNSLVDGYLQYLSKIRDEIIIPEGTNFYRVREWNTKKKFERKDLFHIPFDERYKVKAYRFSVSGTPSLYLSNSLEFAFRETGIKNDFGAIRFENKSEIKIINVDFSYFLPNNLEENINQNPVILEMLGISWPIIAACSIKRSEDTAFKAEYIIPQLLMLYVIKNKKYDVNGIQYYSTHVDSYNIKEHKNNYNLVLPTKSAKTKGYDENLSRLFKMTEVIKTKKNDIAKAQSKLECMPAFEIDF